jgi:predicted metal-dependent peptidase
MKFDERIQSILGESKLKLTGTINVDKLIKKLKIDADVWNDIVAKIDDTVDAKGSISDEEINEFVTDIMHDYAPDDDIDGLEDVIMSYIYLKNTRG